MLKGLKEGFEAFGDGQTDFQRREKQMAGASSCDSCFGKACGRPAGGFEGFEGFKGKQTAGFNALKNIWLGQTAGSWLGRVAARVALERPAEGFEALAGACSCESCLGKACGKVWSWELPRRVWAFEA